MPRGTSEDTGEILPERPPALNCNNVSHEVLLEIFETQDTDYSIDEALGILQKLLNIDEDLARIILHPAKDYEGFPPTRCLFKVNKACLSIQHKDGTIINMIDLNGLKLSADMPKERIRAKTANLSPGHKHLIEYILNHCEDKQWGYSIPRSAAEPTGYKSVSNFRKASIRLVEKLKEIFGEENVIYSKEKSSGIKHLTIKERTLSAEKAKIFL